MASGRHDYGGDKKLSNFAADMFTAWSEKSLISSLMQRGIFFSPILFALKFKVVNYWVSLPTPAPVACFEAF